MKTVLSIVLTLACAGAPAFAADGKPPADGAVKSAKKKIVKRSAKAKKKPVKAAAVPAKKHTGELQTNVKFDDSVLYGQYQTPEEALVKVENEKGLGDLIGVRKHFKDRLETASGQE
jgi:hypothetical protein